MPGWQITLIAIGAALLAATAAVLVDRGRMAHEAHATTASTTIRPDRADTPAARPSH
jgi:hypothetical protein